MFSKSVSISHFTATCLVGSVLMGSPALADRFEATSTVTTATLYPQGAMVTRELRLTVPQGTHEIALADIPLGAQSAMVRDSLQIAVEGARIGPVRYGTATLGEAALYQSDEAQAAKAMLDALRDELRIKEREIAAIRLEVSAAEDSLAYLEGLTAGENATSESLAATARMIRKESLAARLAAQDATTRAQEAEQALDALREDIRQAEVELSRLVPSDAERLALTLPVTADAAGEVHVSMTYMTPNASWQPLYTARLDTEAETLSLTRSVLASQQTGEVWADVALSFATDNPTRRSFPSELYENIRRVYEPRPVEPVMRSEAMSLDMASAPAPKMEAAQVAMQTNLSGLSQTYHFPTPARLYSGDDAVEFALSTLDLTPEITVRAVPLYEDVGYLMASFTNDSGEMLVPGPVRLLRDGVSLGETEMETLVDGAEAELAFGAMDGIQLDRVVLTRNEGDRGVISKSGEHETEWRITVTNLTAREWPVEILDRVSVSEQEDLKIDWTASPMPDVEDVDDKRGVLAWHVDLAAGESQEIVLSESLRWPDGKFLQ
ncbi:DUF4139 domain-containing protein [Celeribacter halophilus]|uniref:DUF4139 domain-containing protein n=1 Tax=Celeribacter halophilus TaxID=576117 RepID=A0A1I3T012_9RHOB|nr:DUF4139 domain-containing protein [Celeribacter halophilus]PZX12046.1 uncharacterized protein (TIGR02231 family) [Celeribacter halophilus]SFJ63171.1 conserved hypothetical protein [Celeribacter halophilus]